MNKKKKKKKSKTKKKNKNDKNIKASYAQTFHVIKFDFDNFEVILNNDSDDCYIYFYNIHIHREAAQEVIVVVTINLVEND